MEDPDSPAAEPYYRCWAAGFAVMPRNVAPFDDVGSSQSLRIDMPEGKLLAFLDEKPHVTVGDLYLLSRYLFNLSSAVRQAVKKDLAALSQQQMLSQEGPRVWQRPQSIVARWADRLAADLKAEQQEGAAVAKGGTTEPAESVNAPP